MLYIYIYVCMCIYIYIYTCIHTCIQPTMASRCPHRQKKGRETHRAQANRKTLNTSICVYIHIHMYISLSLSIYIYIYIHVHIHIHIGGASRVSDTYRAARNPRTLRYRTICSRLHKELRQFENRHYQFGRGNPDMRAAATLKIPQRFSNSTRAPTPRRPAPARLPMLALPPPPVSYPVIPKGTFRSPKEGHPRSRKCF